MYTTTTTKRIQQMAWVLVVFCYSILFQKLFFFKNRILRSIYNTYINLHNWPFAFVSSWKTFRSLLSQEQKWNEMIFCFIWSFEMMAKKISFFLKLKGHVANYTVLLIAADVCSLFIWPDIKKCKQFLFICIYKCYSYDFLKEYILLKKSNSL